MSLHAAAQHLSSKGRGPDETLVHMSHDEVRSLNDIARAHGGSLTVNPETGLPEAGFLSSILPMIGGAALMATGIGAPMAALLMGGGTAMMTGDLKKGLMAGLGAYGGAGLGESLMSAGAAGAVPAAEAAAETVAANPLAGLDMSGATTAGVNPTAISQAAPEAFTTPVAGPSPTPTNALPTQGAFNPTQVTNMPGTNYAASVNPTDAMASLPSQESLANQVREGAQNMSNAGSAVPTVEPDMSQYTRGMGATPASADASRQLTFSENLSNMGKGITTDNLMGWAKEHPYSAAGLAASALSPMLGAKPLAAPVSDSDMGQRYTYAANKVDRPFPTPDASGREQRYFNPAYTKVSSAEAKNLYGFANGGPIEEMSNANAVGANTGYPMADISKGAYATPYQTPISRNVIADVSDTGVNPITGEMTNFARGGLSSAASHLGDYSDGGRLLRGPGDGVSDSIPAVIGKKQPARLADGEFVVPARIVSELGNGSTEAGARKLYAMLDRVQAARKKSIGKGNVAKNSRADKLLPA